MPRNPERQSPKAAPGQAYGERKKQMEAQKKVPLENEQAGQPPASKDPMEALRGFDFNSVTPGGMAAPPAPGEPSNPRAGLPQGRPQMNPGFAKLIEQLPILEAQANDPGSSAAFKSFYFALRGMVPTDIENASDAIAEGE